MNCKKLFDEMVEGISFNISKVKNCRSNDCHGNNYRYIIKLDGILLDARFLNMGLKKKRDLARTIWYFYDIALKYDELDPFYFKAEEFLKAWLKYKGFPFEKWTVKEHLRMQTFLRNLI